MLKTYRKWNESGVSEVVGFIIIIALVMTGIGLVTLYGYPVLLKEQSNANIRNMERNMIVIQNDIKSLAYKNVPYKETSIQVSGGTLFSIDSARTPQQLEIREGLGAGTIIGGVSPFNPGELRYISNDGTATVSIENGAVNEAWLSDTTGSVMIAEPRWFIDEIDSDGDGILDQKTVVINLIEIKSPELSQTSIGNVQLEIKPPVVIDKEPDGNRVTIIYSQLGSDKNYRKAWDNFINSKGFNEISNVDRIIIKKYEIDVLSL